MLQERIEREFQRNYPNDRILFSSKGMMIKRIGKGEKKTLGFISTIRNSDGVLILSNRRAHFANKMNWKFSRFLIPIQVFFFIILLLTLFGALFISASIKPVVLLFLGPIYLLGLLMVFPLGLFMSGKFTKEWKDIERATVRRYDFFRTHYDRIDVYDGDKTVHLLSYTDIPEEVKDLI